MDLQGASFSLAYESGGLDVAWANRSITSSAFVLSETTGDMHRDLDGGRITFTPDQSDAAIMVFPRQEVPWRLDASEGDLASAPVTPAPLADSSPIEHPAGPLSANISGTSVWSDQSIALHQMSGDFVVSVFGGTLTFDDGETLRVGRDETASVQEYGQEVIVQAISSGWIEVQGAELALTVQQAGVRNTYVHGLSLVTEGATTLRGPLLDEPAVFEGRTEMTVVSAGDGLSASIRQGPIAPTEPSSNALARPSSSTLTWLWGGLGAVFLVAAFGVVALASTSVAHLESRTYMSLDRHRPRLASFWAWLWARRDPWDGHAWSARGEAWMLRGQDRRAARAFTTAQARLPPDERAINALHAARSFARLGRGTETAHWIGIVASLDLNVLVTAREEPDFAAVWDHAAVQRAVQGALGQPA